MLLDAPFATPAIAHRRSILADSILASSLDRRALERLEALGEVVAVPSGTVVFEEGAPSDHLYVVLDGALIPSTPSGPPSFWVGPGDLCGEGGFVTGSRRGTTMVAFGPDPRFWRIHRDVLSRLDEASNVVVTRLLGAVARTIEARLEAPRAGAAAWTEADYCDQNHPSVRALARRLDRGTPHATACAIWAALWRMPYRFGTWQCSASETLARGHGMCTTKAILQVALMRALGIECGYVKGLLDGPLVRACMPRVYSARFQRPTFKHYYAAARMDGRWIPFDASFSRGSLGLIAETEPSVLPFVRWDAEVEGYADGSASMNGTDPYAVEVHQDLTEVMRKTATYDAKNADAMNVLLDRAQGYVAPVKGYVSRMDQALAADAPATARAMVLEGLEEDVDALRRRSRTASARAA